MEITELRREDEKAWDSYMFLMRSVIFGKKLVSVPFAPYGGVCADSETVEKALIDEVK